MRYLKRILGIGLSVAVGVAVLASCSSGKTNSQKAGQKASPPTDAIKSPAASDTASAEATASRTPKTSAESAVLALLEAEQNGDRRASFGMVSTAGLAAYPSEDTWATRRTELAPVTAFTPESVAGSDVTVLVSHRATIDPFVGLQFAQEHQIWHARHEANGWLVDPEPTVKPIVPSAALAGQVAIEWVTARQACDDLKTKDLQAVATLFGSSAGAAKLCRSKGSLSVGQPAQAQPGPQTADLVSQYGSRVLPYVRRVPVSGGPTPFSLFLVPMGDSWRVVSAND